MVVNTHRKTKPPRIYFLHLLRLELIHSKAFMNRHVNIKVTDSCGPKEVRGGVRAGLERTLTSTRGPADAHQSASSL